MKREKMNLAEFYESLPSPTPPKTDFIERVANRTGLKQATIRFWVKGRHKPSDEMYLKVLSEESGIPVEDLFA